MYIYSFFYGSCMLTLSFYSYHIFSNTISIISIFLLKIWVSWELLLIVSLKYISEKFPHKRVNSWYDSFLNLVLRILLLLFLLFLYLVTMDGDTVLSVAVEVHILLSYALLHHSFDSIQSILDFLESFSANIRMLLLYRMN